MTFDKSVQREPLQKTPEEILLERLTDPKHFIEAEVNRSRNVWIHAYGSIVTSTLGFFQIWKDSNKYSGEIFERTFKAVEQLENDYQEWKSATADGTIPVAEESKQEYLQRFEPIRQGMEEFLKK